MATQCSAACVGSVVKRIVQLVVVYTLIAIYGTLWMLAQVPRIWKDSKAYFATKTRTIPSKVKEPEVGEHGYLQLSVRYIPSNIFDISVMIFGFII